MKNRMLSCDRDWTVMTVLDKHKKIVYLNYTDIDQIRIGYYTESKFFSKKSSERIEIVTRNGHGTIMITKPSDWDNFEQYKQEALKFAKDNNIELVAYD